MADETRKDQDATKKVDFEVDELTNELDDVSGGLATVDDSCSSTGCSGCKNVGGCSGCTGCA